jgi:hypothetical protein
VAAVKAKTDLIGASVSTLTQAQIISDTTPFLGASIATIKTSTDKIGATVALETGGNMAAIKTKTDLIGASVGLTGEATAALAANAFKRQAGVTQIFQKVVTQAANSGAYTLATVTTQACLIKDIVVKAVTAVQTDLTSAAVTGGAADCITFLSATDAAKANITAIDQQVAWRGAVELAAAKTIVMTLVGTGATPVDLLVTIRFKAAVDGGYLA